MLNELKLQLHFNQVAIEQDRSTTETLHDLFREDMKVLEVIRNIS
jgi:hypothetical protein